MSPDSSPVSVAREPEPESEPEAFAAAAATGNADGLLRDGWYLAAPARAVKPGTQARRMICGEPVLLGRTKGGEAFALRDVCPHRAVPLSAGCQVDTDGQPSVQCPYHGWRFGLDGACVHMPSLVDGQAYETRRVRVRRYPVHEAHGLIFLWMAADPRDERPPDIAPPDFGLGDTAPRFVVSRVFEAHMDNAVVGLMDPAHVPFVHTQWWWRPPSSGFKEKTKAFEPRGRGWAMPRHAPSSNSLAYRLVFGADVTTEIVFELPGFRWEIVENDRARFFTLTCLTPRDARSTLITQATWWFNTPVLELIRPFLVSGAREFLDQDGRMVDLQNQGLPHVRSMLWIDDIDIQAKWYHRLKREWTASRAEARPFANPLKPANLRWRS